jgi:hypothetical protein
MTELASFHVELGILAEWLATVGTVAAFAATWVVISRDISPAVSIRRQPPMTSS